MSNDMRPTSKEGSLGPSRQFCSDLLFRLAQINGLSPSLVSIGVEALEKNGKQFCVGLLENPEKHAWGGASARLPNWKKVSLAGSLFLLRKVLPSPPNPQQARSHRDLMSKAAPPVSEDYYRHIRATIAELFPKGWDRRYESYCDRYIPTDSSSLESNRKKGGAKAYLREEISLDAFRRAMLTGLFCPDSFSVKYLIVQAGGKARGVTIASAMSHVLGPLHRMIYDRLSGCDWLLRGDAKASRFSTFQRKEGEVFVSGDYESATDNLNLGVSEFILQCILDRCCSVPTGIREYALRSLRSTISYSDLPEVKQERGQMMGNLLSFPLLCLNNFLAFKYLVPRPDVPVKINGDDIVFRCRRSEWEAWAAGVNKLGLTLSRGKTLVRENFFSLNSAFFYACAKKVRDVPVVRASMLVPKPDGSPPTPESFIKFLRGWKGESSTVLGGYYLRCHRRVLAATGRSIEALGIPANRGQIACSGMADRERFLRPTRSERSVGVREEPMPPVRLRGGVSGTPPGWVAVDSASVGKGAKKRFAREYCRDAYAHSWATNFTPDTDRWWKEVRGTGSGSGWDWFRKTKVGRLSSKLPRKSLLGLLPPLLDTVTCRSKRRVWVRLGPYSGPRDLQVVTFQRRPVSSGIRPPEEWTICKHRGTLYSPEQYQELGFRPRTFFSGAMA